MAQSSDFQRVWLLCGAALAALFLLRTAGMVFQGAITGLGMFVGIWVLFAWFPPIKKLLFSMGGVFDLAVSFGLPYLITRGLGITGGTMLIATLCCGLLFTFTLTTKRLGGPVRAVTSSTSMIVRDTMSSFEAWREEKYGRHDQVERRDPGERGRARQHREREEGQAGSRGRDDVVDVDYRVL